MPLEIQVLQDRDMVLREVFTHEADALGWASEYSNRLKAHGWHDSPEDFSPSSAA